jgi:hypothetical protein
MEIDNLALTTFGVEQMQLIPTVTAPTVRPIAKPIWTEGLHSACNVGEPQVSLNSTAPRLVRRISELKACAKNSCAC